MRRKHNQLVGNTTMKSKHYQLVGEQNDEEKTLSAGREHNNEKSPKTTKININIKAENVASERNIKTNS